MTSQAVTIPEDTSLLRIMLEDGATQPPIYKPGKYWADKTKNAVKEIEKFGLNDFRGSTNSVGTSFTDSFYCDTRTLLSFGLRKHFRCLFDNVFPFKTIFNAQVALTRVYAEEALRLRAYVYANSARVAELLGKYTMPYSVAGGCLDFFNYKGQKISHHYLNLLDTHDAVAKKVDFTKARSFFEIGGGFGVNAHLLIENYPNLRKFIYLDIPPNLYVGTQYLKAFYGKNVRDYQSTRALSEITFANNDELEIICIAPWQIEKLKVSVDIFYNAHSFVEMTPEIVKNYARHIEALPNAALTKVALVSYDQLNLSKALHPDVLKTYFHKDFENHEQDVLPNGERKNYIYTSL